MGAPEETEQERIDRERFVSSLVEVTPGILYVYDLLERRIVWTNKGIQRILGWTPQEIGEMGGDLLPALMHPDDLAVFRDRTVPRYATASDEAAIRSSFRMKTRLGEWCWLESDERIFRRNPDGTPRGIFGLAIDVTDRMRAEEALRDSEYFFKESQRASMTGSYRLHFRTGYWDYSEVLGEIFGIDATFPNNVDGWLRMVHPDDQAMMTRHFQVDVAERHHPFDKVYRIVRPSDGEIRWMHGQGRLVLDDEEKPIHMIGTIRDVTERKRGEEELERHRGHLEELVRERTAQLEAANAELDAFSRSVSHDLRAPVRRIAGFASLLASDCREALPEEGRGWLDSILGSTRRMAALIEDLLAFARAGRQELSQGVADMDALLGDVLHYARESLGERRVEWRVGPLGEVPGDCALLRQVWANLVENALKYSSRREVAHIAIRAEDGDGERIFVIEDDGAGFDPRHATKLFEPFQRMHRDDEFEGSGIGLASVRRILERHGGRIWAEAEPEKGAIFRFALPL